MEVPALLTAEGGKADQTDSCVEIEYLEPEEGKIAEIESFVAGPSTKKAQKRRHTAKQNACTDKWQRLATEKLESAKEKRLQQREQHELTVACMKEEHALKLEILKLQKQKLLIEMNK